MPYRDRDNRVKVEIPGGDKIPAEPVMSQEHGAGFMLDYTKMYEAPGAVTFAFLKQLSEHFGTDAIDVDAVSEGGCDSCNWGSRYGHEIQVYGATKNVPVFG